MIAIAPLLLPFVFVVVAVVACRLLLLLLLLLFLTKILIDRCTFGLILNY